MSFELFSKNCRVWCGTSEMSCQKWKRKTCATW